MKKNIILSVGAIALVSFIGAKYYASSVAKDRVDSILASAPPILKGLTYKDVSVGLLTGSVTFKDVEFSSPAKDRNILINEVVLNDYDEESEIPSYMDLEFNGIEAEIKQIDELSKLGYEDYLSSNMAISYEFDAKAGEVNIKNLSMGIDDLGSIRIELKLSNIKNPAALIFTYPSVQIDAAKIVYEDDSLIDRAYTLRAKKEKKSVDEIKDDAIQILDSKIEKTSGEFQKNVLLAIRNFIDDPDELTISVSPQSPVSIKQLLSVRDPQYYIELLKLEVDS
jgi:hypothetical protein